MEPAGAGGPHVVTADVVIKKKTKTKIKMVKKKRAKKQVPPKPVGQHAPAEAAEGKSPEPEMEPTLAGEEGEEDVEEVEDEREEAAAEKETETRERGEPEKEPQRDRKEESQGDLGQLSPEDALDLFERAGAALDEHQSALQSARELSVCLGLRSLVGETDPVQVDFEERDDLVGTREAFECACKEVGDSRDVDIQKLCDSAQLELRDMFDFIETVHRSNAEIRQRVQNHPSDINSLSSAPLAQVKHSPRLGSLEELLSTLEARLEASKGDDMRFTAAALRATVAEKSPMSVFGLRPNASYGRNAG